MIANGRDYKFWNHKFTCYKSKVWGILVEWKQICTDLSEAVSKYFVEIHLTKLNFKLSIEISAWDLYFKNCTNKEIPFTYKYHTDQQEMHLHHILF